MLAVIVLFDRFTALDAVGPYEVLSSLPGAEVVFAAHTPGPVVNEKGTLRLTADAALADVLQPDVIVVPGGPGQNAHMADEALLGWLRAADARSAWTTSVCTGSLLLASAGLLKGRRATTHWLAMDKLAGLGAVPGDRTGRHRRQVHDRRRSVRRTRHGPRARREARRRRRRPVGPARPRIRSATALPGRISRHRAPGHHRRPPRPPQIHPARARGTPGPQPLPGAVPRRSHSLPHRLAKGASVAVPALPARRREPVLRPTAGPASWAEPTSRHQARPSSPPTTCLSSTRSTCRCCSTGR